MKLKKRLCLVLAAVMCLVLLASGCGSKETKTLNTSNVDLSKYPIETEEELTLWRIMPGQLSTVTDNMETTVFSQELAKRTGVKIKYIHPAAGQTVEAFNLMVASNELPDLIAYTWSWYNGGVQGAIDDKIIVPLNDIMEDYAPELTKYLKENPQYDRMVKTDKGEYPYFPQILDGEKLTATTGPAIRQDLLDKYGLETPETIEDWTNVLRTFKENGIKKPLSFPYNMMSVLYKMFSASDNFYRDENDVIQLGLVDESYKEALIGIKAWYDEGLLDRNIVSVDGKMANSYVLSGDTAATITAAGSGIGTFMDSATIDGFNMVGVMYPVKERGTVSKYTEVALNHGGSGIAITTKCKNPALAAKVLDYLYSEEGRMFSNFGIEGESYTMVDGYPTYTDLIMNNPDKKPLAQMLSDYTRANCGYALIQDERYIEQYYSKPQQKIASEAWAKGAKLSMETFAVPYTVLTSEEGAESAAILNNIVTYAKGMSAKFITGVEPIEKFDEYVENIKKLGLDRLLEIQNAAYKRYKNR